MEIEGILLVENFIEQPTKLFDDLKHKIVWDDRMKARKTASYGVAYNYSQMEYPFQQPLPEILQLQDQLAAKIGFTPNNCLINWYENGRSTMGYHADRIDNLEDNTGIAIISLGAERPLYFRNQKDPSIKYVYSLPSGSLFYMTQEIQKDWKHAIRKSSAENARMSLTFRKIKV